MADAASEESDEYSDYSDASQELQAHPKFLLFTSSEQHEPPRVDRLATAGFTPPWNDARFQSLRLAAWSGALGALAFLHSTDSCSASDHAASRSIIRAAHLQGAQVYFWMPQPCPEDIESEYVHLCQELAAHCIWLATPNGEPKLLCTSDSAVAELSSAKAPWPSLMHRIASHCTSLLTLPVHIDRMNKYLPAHFLPSRPAICDGAGLFSSADHSASNVSTKPKPLKGLASTFLTYLKSHGLISHITAQLQNADDKPPLSEEQGLVLSEIIRQTLAPHADPGTFHEIAPGQPFRLNVLQCLASALQDKDSGLPALLAEGVPTGAFEPLPSSGQWTPAQPELDFSQEFSPASLERCRGNWLAAESNQELLEQLVQDEIAKGFVKPFDGDEADAAQHWPQGTAIGKLNIVTAEGRDPRLVLDSTICGLNPAVQLPEHVALPTASDVQRSFLAQDCYASLVALSLDFKAAHKCCKVKPADQGTLLFRVGGKLYYYTVCHFGARFSAYWWQRTGALILRCIHALLCNHPHRAWLYVDDLLALLRKGESAEAAALVVALLAALHAPISWKKAQFSTSVTWCGWNFCTLSETIELRQAKLLKLREQLAALQQQSKVPRKALEGMLGLLNWATSLSKHLRPFMAPLYKDLHSAKGTLHSISPTMWQAFYDALDNKAKLIRTPSGSWLPRNAQLLEVGNIKISTKSDVPLVPPSHKHQWVRLADPHRSEIHLRKESKFVLAWLAQCFAHEQPRSLRTAPRLHCYSAADAFADTARIGIGGWLSTATEFIWFSEIFTADQVRAQWPQLHGSMQPYIGCFETLAQLALAQCTWHCLRSRHVKFVLPSATDNTSAESGLNKLFSTAEPLGLFLRLAATWAHLHRVQFELEHLAGEKNVWADKLSRDNISFLQHRSAERRRISLAELASASHCVTLHDTGHAWPAPLVRAQHAMLR